MLISSAELQQMILEEVPRELLDEISYDTDELEDDRADEYAEKAMTDRRAANLSSDAVGFMKLITAAGTKIDDDRKLAPTLRTILLHPERVRSFAKLAPNERAAVWKKVDDVMGPAKTAHVTPSDMRKKFEQSAADIAAGKAELDKKWYDPKYLAYAGGNAPPIRGSNDDPEETPIFPGDHGSSPADAPDDLQGSSGSYPPVSGPDPDRTKRSRHRWGGMGGYASDLQGTTTRVPPVSGPDPEETAPTATPVDGPDPAETIPGTWPPVSGPAPEGGEEGAPAPSAPQNKTAAKLARSRSVKEFFNTFLEAVTDSFDGNTKQQAAALKQLHNSRRILQDLSGEGKLAADGEIDFDNEVVKQLLDRYVYDFGLPTDAALPYKKHFVTLVHNAEQKRRGEEEDASYLANTGTPKEKATSSDPQAAAKKPTPSQAATQATNKDKKPMSRRERSRLDKLRSTDGKGFEPLDVYPGRAGQIPAQALIDLDLTNAEDEQEIANFLRSKGYEITEANVKGCAAILNEHRQLKRWKELASII